VPATTAPQEEVSVFSVGLDSLVLIAKSHARVFTEFAIMELQELATATGVGPGGGASIVSSPALV
jgi:hypothetical protein